MNIINDNNIQPINYPDSIDEPIKFEEEIIQSTQELINELQLGAFEQESIEDIPNLELIQSTVSNVENEVQEIINDLKINEKINVIFDPSNTSSDTEKVKKFLDDISSEFKVIQDKMKLNQQSRELKAEVVEYLSIPTVSLSVGIEIAEIVSRHVNSFEEIGSEILNDSLIGLEFLSLGFQCFTLQKQGQIISSKEEHKNNLLMKLEKEQNPGNAILIHEQVAFLEKEIKVLRSDFQEKTIKISTKFLLATFEGSKEVLNFVSSSSKMISAHAEVIGKLVISSAALSVGGALISLGWSTYQVCQNSSKLNHTHMKINAVSQQLKSLTQNEIYIAYMLQAKLDRLKNLENHQTYQLGMQILNMSSASLALVASSKIVLAAAGIALSATAGAVLGGTGLVGIALFGGGIAVGVGVKTYQKRDTIKHTLKSIPIATQKLILKKQLRATEEMHKNIVNQIDKLTHNISENIKKQSSLQVVPKNINELLKRKNPQIIHQQTIQQFEMLVNQLNNANLMEVIFLEKEKALKHNLDSLEKTSHNNAIDYKLRTEQKKFKKYDLMTIEVIKKVLSEGLTNEIVRDQLKDFLIAQGYPIKGEPTIDNVLDYILDDK
ncbi:MAG: hypothetical protein Q8K60_01800 [Parachlamydiaceae bacterium]|nr:hypothetical protein [Parachlamydiaceae bacterium]